MDFNTSYSANEFAKRALEYSAHCTVEQNKQRQQTGRKQNVSQEFEEAEPQEIGASSSSHAQQATQGLPA